MEREKSTIEQDCGNTFGTRFGKAATSLRVLLVDDEPDVRQSLALLFGVDGHSVTAAASGVAALHELESARFDLVITDYRMQGMNGDELARRIKAKYPDTPIVMLTGIYEKPIGPENPVLAIYHKPDQIKDLREAMVCLGAN